MPKYWLIGAVISSHLFLPEVTPLTFGQEVRATQCQSSNKEALPIPPSDSALRGIASVVDNPEFLEQKVARDCSYRLAHYAHDGRTHWGLVTPQTGSPGVVIVIDEWVRGLEFNTEGFHEKLCRIYGAYTKDPIKAQKRFKFLGLRPEDVLPPIPQPKNIVCVGLNYREHNEETGQQSQRSDDLVFPKPVELTSPYAKVRKPKGSILDYEGELGVVIRKSIDTQTIITPENVHEYISGFVLANDLSNREPIIRDQKSGFTKGKSNPGFLPVGPYFIPIAETARGGNVNPRIDLKTYVNGNLRQSDNSQNMLRSFSEMINLAIKKRAERWETYDGRWVPLLQGGESGRLEAGDLLLTGTPGGTAIKKPNLGKKVGLFFAGLFSFGPQSPTSEFIDWEKENPAYLYSGHKVTVDGGPLGVQRFAIEDSN